MDRNSRTKGPVERRERLGRNAQFLVPAGHVASHLVSGDFWHPSSAPPTGVSNARMGRAAGAQGTRLTVLLRPFSVTPRIRSRKSFGEPADPDGDELT